jgi:phosphoribosylformylglycinamidine synthase
MTQPITAALARQFGLNNEEYARVLTIMGRTPTLTELGIFSVMWSEHCSYKSSRVHLRELPTTAPWVIYGPGENAGVVDIGGGLAAIFKMESHNHPSFIEPYQGAATGVGGILRDVFTMGARPIANLNALRFGRPENPVTKRVLDGVVRGIGGYGNCVGVPTVGGEVNFHAAYDGNPLVNAMTVGIARTDAIFLSAAAGIGNPVIYVGSKTGRDGIHGATMASAEFDANSEEKRPTVQVGDPFTEKLLIEACLELMQTDAIVAIQDMGAAGLTSSSVEMAGRGGVGIDLDLDAVPQRESAMNAYEMMLSESQERMLMVLKPERQDLARAIFEKWELDFAVVGHLTDTGRITVRHRGKVEADIELAPLADQAPLYRRPYTTPPKPAPVAIPDDPVGILAALQTLIGCPDLCSRAWIWNQYDSTVGGQDLVLLGDTAGHLGQSLWLREIAGLETGAPPPVDFAAERRVGAFVRGQIAAGRIAACHDVSDGGLLITLAEMALAGRIGVTLVAPPSSIPPHAFWFGEDQARYVAATEDAPALLASAEAAAVQARRLGGVGGDHLTLASGATISICQLREEHERFFPAWMNS